MNQRAREAEGHQGAAGDPLGHRRAVHHRGRLRGPLEARERDHAAGNMGLGYWADAPRTTGTSTRPRPCSQQASNSPSRSRVHVHRGDRREDRSPRSCRRTSPRSASTVTLKQLDSGTYYAVGRGASESRELFYVGFVTQPDPSWSTVWFTCDQIDVWNWSTGATSEYDRLHFAAIKETDAAKRNEMYIEMQKLWDAAATRRLDSLPDELLRSPDRASSRRCAPDGRSVPHALPGRVASCRAPRSGLDGPLTYLLSGSPWPASSCCCLMVVPRRARPPRCRAIPVRTILGPRASEDLSQTVRAEMDLDDPGARAGRTNFVAGRRCRATSARTSSASCSVTTLIGEALPHTIILAAASLGLAAIMLGVPLGVYASTRPNSLGRPRWPASSRSRSSPCPSYVAGLFLLLLFAVQLDCCRRSGSASSPTRSTT